MGLFCIYNLNYIFSFLLQRPSPDRSDILFIMEAEAIEAEIYKKIKRIAVKAPNKATQFLLKSDNGLNVSLQVKLKRV
jgi:hypothetical protein